MVQLAARHAFPATYPVRDFAEAGGLMRATEPTLRMRGVRPASIPAASSRAETCGVAGRAADQV